MNLSLKERHHGTIIPALMRFDRHAELEFPLDSIDREAAARWIDDRIIHFVRTYLRLHEGDC